MRVRQTRSIPTLSVLTTALVLVGSLVVADAPAEARRHLRLTRRAATKASGWTPDQRPLRVLSRRGDVYKVKDLRTGFVDNNVKKPVFQQAVLDVSKVTKAYYAVQKPTAPKWAGKLVDKLLRRTATGHAMLFFETADGGVTATKTGTSAKGGTSASGTGAKGGKGKAFGGLVFSPEARLKKGQGYGFVRGLKKQEKGGFGQIGVLSTLGERITKSTAMEHSVVELYQVDAKKIDIKALARSSIEAAASYDPKESYNTLRSNCGTKCAARFEQVGGKQLGRSKWVPSLIPGELFKQGWIVSKKPTKVLTPAWR